ncbi:PP2C family protein-serine/threonine phosphatase [Streptomyces cyaneofuscatus]|uniref:PP2C family protein-serine/threonine phosphatase n=1 Tax=Streptomyces cyaneofuscatus TaxID=66883 RepID=UPI00332307C5
MLPSPRLGSRRITLAPGQSLVLYTDGIIEARNHANELFDETRLIQALTRPPPRATAVLDTLTAAVRSFTGGRGIDDDQAVLVLTATRPGAGTGE